MLDLGKVAHDSGSSRHVDMRQQVGPSPVGGDATGAPTSPEARIAEAFAVQMAASMIDASIANGKVLDNMPGKDPTSAMRRLQAEEERLVAELREEMEDTEERD